MLVVVIVTCRATTDMNEDKGEDDGDDQACLYHCLCFFPHILYVKFMLAALPGRNLP